jgi:hypothetical protein
LPILKLVTSCRPKLALIRGCYYKVQKLRFVNQQLGSDKQVRETEIQNLGDVNRQVCLENKELRESIAKLRKSITSKERRIASKWKVECRG